MRLSAEARRIRLLERIDSILGSSYELSKVIRRIYQETGKVLDTSNFYIAIFDRKEEMIHFAVYTINGKELEASSRKFGNGMTEYVIKTKRAWRIGRNLKKQAARHGIRPFGKSARSWLGVPMLYKNSVEGVIAIQDYERTNAYGPDDEKFLFSIASRAAVVIANTRLMEDEINRARELALMNEVAHRMTRRLNIDAISESLTRTIIKHFKNLNVAIFLIRDNKIALKSLSLGFREEVPRNLTLEPGQGLVGQAVRTGKTIVVNDIGRDRRYLAFGQTCTRSEIAIPLIISRRAIGVLDVQCNEKNAFSPGTVRILELIADRFTAALHNARLYEDATNHARELSVSFSIAKSLISALELDEVLGQIVTVIRKSFNFANIAILLIDREKKDLYVKAAHGYANRLLKNLRLKIGKQGICGRVAANGEAFYAPDVRKIPFYHQWKKSIRSEVAIPLKIRDEVIGVLDIESERVNDFDERDLRLFTIFASQAAVAIENARLYDETKSLSLTDALTRIANRRHFDLMIENEFKKARGYTRPMSLAILDIDDFKHFNDNYGHLSGDRILVHIAATLKENLRDTDFIARYGGEEFVIIFPETPSNVALRVSERIRASIENNRIMIKVVGKKACTVSIGISTFPGDADGIVELIQNADKALYRAKQLGKNRVEAT